jgi:hypothetical protein
MTDLHLSNFSESGVNTGNDSSLPYLYGLSDFFHIMFEDKEVVDLMLEGNALTAAEIYSRFLQITSSVSLETIQSTTGVGVALILVNSANAVGSLGNVYTVSTPLQSAKHVSNRPFLPTEVLDANVDFEINQVDASSATITFAKPISAYKFSHRPLADGSTQYAVWVSDAVVDESLVYKAFGSLIGASSETASDSYTNFIYGLYYLYTHGPTLKDMRRGLNLILGVPLARSKETVLEVRFYSESKQYVVVTDQNQYLIPYGLAPTVAVDDVLEVGQELSQWVEIKDYQSDGEWWLNLRIPEKIIPVLPEGQANRYASKGSHLDYAMRTFLKNHTFLVNVKVDGFKNVQQFAQISEIINKAKPSYTQPVYVWTVSSVDEDLTLTDSELVMNLRFSTCDHMFPDFATMRRHPDPDGSLVSGEGGTPVDPSTLSETRACATYLRWMGTPRNSIITGNSSTLSNYSGSIDGMAISGVCSPFQALGAASDYDNAVANAIMTRSSDTWSVRRGTVMHRRGLAPASSGEGVSTRSFATMLDVAKGSRVIPLYATSEEDVISKCTALGYDSPLSSEWIVYLLGTKSTSYAINELGINRGSFTGSGQARVMYSLLFFKNQEKGDISSHNPDFLRSWSWVPDTTDILDDDYLVAVRTSEKTFAVYWVTTNLAVKCPHFIDFKGQEADLLSMTFTTPPNRGSAISGQTPYYFARGWGASSQSDDSAAINEMYLNKAEPNITITPSYSDELNSAVTTTRDTLRPTLTHRVVA